MSGPDLPRRGLGRGGWLLSVLAGALAAVLVSVAASGPIPVAVVGSPQPRTSSVAPVPASTPAPAPGLPTAGTASTSVPVDTPKPGSTLGGCPNLPAGDVWHAQVTGLPVHQRSGSFVDSIGTGPVKADFGAGLWDGAPIGIPITVVPGGQARVPVTFEYADESDPGPYPIPKDAAVEGGGDRHVLVVDGGACRLYELFDAKLAADGSWKAGSGAVFDLRSERLRPAGWTSADAAGLPIAPGLVRYDEVATGRIDHAIRVTVPRSQNAYLWPARHAASRSADQNLPPMGLRLRLKASVDISKLPAQARVVAQALKTHGAIVADNGSAWFLSGAPDNRWNNDDLRALSSLHGNDFEALDSSPLMADPNSGQAR